MKKYAAGFTAVILAIGMSAFTATSGTNNSQSLWYKDGTNFLPYSGEACPVDNQIQCKKVIPGVGERSIFTQPNDQSPLMTRP